MKSQKLLSLYYLATPVFVAAELLFDAKLRIVIPWAGDSMEYWYMGLCFVLGGFVFKKGVAQSIFVLIECSLNILLLIASVYMSIMSLAENPQTMNGFTFGLTELSHLFIVGSILIASFYSNPIILLGNKRG